MKNKIFYNRFIQKNLNPDNLKLFLDKKNIVNQIDNKKKKELKKPYNTAKTLIEKLEECSK